ncbi:MAG: dehydrogenase [Phycisphaerae bacterium]|jgi:predicted dehydrogenase|nr:MAG: dehydrogenase [Phycisphaerae bacterium]
MIHLGFAGCAHIHTPGFVTMLGQRSDVKVKYVWDPDPRRSKAWSTLLDATMVESVDMILHDDLVQGLIICSETNLHESLVLPATKVKKHLFVEKPLGMGSKDGYVMAHAIQDSGVLFQTGYFQRSDPKHRFIKQQIEKGNLGQIHRVRGSNTHSGAIGNWFQSKPEDPAHDWRWMADPKVAGVGAFGDLGTHALDIMIWWMGEVRQVTAQIDPVTHTYDECDESGEGLIRFSNQTIGTLGAGWVDHQNPLTYQVSGTEGHAAIIQGQLHFLSRKDARFDGSTAVRTNELPPPAPHAFELFLDALVGKDLPVALVSAREAAYRSAVMQAMYEGAVEGKWITPAKN